MNLKKSGVVGIGVDILELERVEKISTRERFAEYFLRASELKAFKKSGDQIAFLASRFAAKEAVIKALPVKVGPHEFEVAKRGEKPFVKFSPRFQKKYKALVSMSHSTRYVVGYALVARL